VTTFLVAKICCGREDGFSSFPDYESADQFREAYVAKNDHGHKRDAIVLVAKPVENAQGGDQ